MKISEQIQQRREKLKLSKKKLADLVGVTEQAVRHWEDGRSFPGKSKRRLVEEALSFTLDWREGVPPPGPTHISMENQEEQELIVKLRKLRPRDKSLITHFIKLMLDEPDQK